jgi:hypothetical protein
MCPRNCWTEPPGGRFGLRRRDLSVATRRGRERSARAQPGCGAGRRAGASDPGGAAEDGRRCTSGYTRCRGGVIERSSIQAAPGTVGLHLTALVAVCSDDGVHRRALAERVRERPAVVERHGVAGEHDAVPTLRRVCARGRALPGQGRGGPTTHHDHGGTVHGARTPSATPGGAQPCRSSRRAIVSRRRISCGWRRRLWRYHSPMSHMMAQTSDPKHAMAVSADMP